MDQGWADSVSAIFVTGSVIDGVPPIKRADVG